MLAVLQAVPGGADTLTIAETAVPKIGPGQLLVRVLAAGVNRADIVQREGRYPPPPGASPILGLEIAGEVVERAEDVTAFETGDPVFGLVGGGAYAEYAVLDAACAIAKPDWLGYEEAATLPEAWMTAWFNLVEIAQLRETESILIHAGASSVGATAIQLAGLIGARAYATAGTADKVAFCEELGAWRGIDYKTHDFADIVMADGGVDVILDCVGGAYLGRNVSSLKVDGRLVTIGLMGGASAPLDMGRLLVKRLTVRGSTLRSQPPAVKARLAEVVRDQVLRAVQQGRVRLTLDKVFAWRDVADAHRYIEASRNMGKVVLSMVEGVKK